MAGNLDHGGKPLPSKTIPVALESRHGLIPRSYSDQLLRRGRRTLPSQRRTASLANDVNPTIAASAPGAANNHRPSTARPRRESPKGAQDCAVPDSWLWFAMEPKKTLFILHGKMPRRRTWPQALLQSSCFLGDDHESCRNAPADRCCRR